MNSVDVIDLVDMDVDEWPEHINTSRAAPTLPTDRIVIERPSQLANIVTLPVESAPVFIPSTSLC